MLINPQTYKTRNKCFLLYGTEFWGCLVEIFCVTADRCRVLPPFQVSRGQVHALHTCVLSAGDATPLMGLNNRLRAMSAWVARMPHWERNPGC